MTMPASSFGSLKRSSQSYCPMHMEGRQEKRVWLMEALIVNYVIWIALPPIPSVPLASCFGLLFSSGTVTTINQHRHHPWISWRAGRSRTKIIVVSLYQLPFRFKFYTKKFIKYTNYKYLMDVILRIKIFAFHYNFSF